jgi:polyisoprenoid-binding protein YceI
MTWNLDTIHSSIGFGVKHMIVATTRGKFTNYEVDAEVDEQDLSRSTATVTIEADSVDTGEIDRDNHLRSADFFDTANHPNITFRTKRLEKQGGDEYKIYGDLTIRGITHEVVLEGEVNGPVEDPYGNQRAGITAEGKIDRKDFGLTFNVPMGAGRVVVGDAVKLTIDLELVKAA